MKKKILLLILALTFTTVLLVGCTLYPGSRQSNRIVNSVGRVSGNNDDTEIRNGYMNRRIASVNAGSENDCTGGECAGGRNDTCTTGDCDGTRSADCTGDCDGMRGANCTGDCDGMRGANCTGDCDGANGRGGQGAGGQSDCNMS